MRGRDLALIVSVLAIIIILLILLVVQLTSRPTVVEKVTEEEQPKQEAPKDAWPPLGGPFASIHSIAEKRNSRKPGFRHCRFSETGQKKEGPGKNTQAHWMP